MLNNRVTVENECNAILAQPCPYTTPPMSIQGGHKFCPCICKVARIAYIGGYKHGRVREMPEVGLETLDPKDMR